MHISYPPATGSTQNGLPIAEGAKTRRWRKIALPALALVMLAGAITVNPATTESTDAASRTGHVYLVMSNRKACPAGGKVVTVHGAVDGVWTGGDAGDNIIYPKVQFGRTNTFNARVFCKRSSWQWWKNYWSNVLWFQFRPTRWNQTFRY